MAGVKFPAFPKVDPLAAEDITDLGNVVLTGDLRSNQWDGGSDLSGGADSDASAGFYIDSSAGVAQFMAIHLTTGAIGTPELADGSVTTVKLDALAVTTAKIDDAAITNAKIANLAVDTAQIASAAITNAKIANAAVDTAQIASAAITNAKINDLSADKITAGTITAREYQTASSGDALRINPGLSGESGIAVRWFRSGTLRGTATLDFTDTAVSLAGNNGWAAKLGASGSEVEARGTTAHLLGDSGSMLIEASTSGGLVKSPSSSVALTAYRQGTSSSADVAHFRSNVGGTNSLHALIKQDGDMENTNNSYGSLSDRRLKAKRSIKPARRYLEDLRRIPISKYRFKRQKKTLLGPIAQDVQPVFPGLVSERSDGYLGVKHSVFVPMLITAVQELADDRDDFRTRLEALETA